MLINRKSMSFKKNFITSGFYFNWYDFYYSISFLTFIYFIASKIREIRLKIINLYNYKLYFFVFYSIDIKAGPALKTSSVQ